MRGQNSLKNNYNQKKIDRHLDYLDGKIEEYLKQIESLEEGNETNDRITSLENKVEAAEERKEFYKEMESQIKDSADGQISTTDPDARGVIKHRNIVEVGYNIQTMVDAKHNLIVDVFAGGVTDRGDLAPGAKRSQDLLGDEKIDLLADKWCLSPFVFRSVSAKSRLTGGATEGGRSGPPS